MGTFHKFSVVTIILLLLFGCGGGGGGGGSTSSAKSTGVFLDSPVINIGYRTETLEGVTNSLGEYEYLPGETVTFFIGDLIFPAVTATGTVTPLDLAGTQDTANSKVMNMIRLLQTLDQDGDPSNGITISDQAKASATQVDFELSTTIFAASPAVMNLIENAGLVTPVTKLVSAADALAHFKQELIDAGILPTEFNYSLYDDFSDPGEDIDLTLWNPEFSPFGTSLLIVNGALQATAVKNSAVRADQGLWVKDVTNVKMADFQAFRADFTILEATGDATNRAQILLGFPLETEDYFVDTGINIYASGEVKYFIEIFNNLGQPIKGIVYGTIATVDPAIVHTLSIGWDGSNYIFQVDNIVPAVIPMSAETDISNANNWSWAAVRATVKDTGTGTTVAKIDNVQRGRTARVLGQLDIVVVDTGSGIYSGTPIGTNISGFINPVPTSGEITNGTTLTAFGCCIAAGGLSVTNNELLDAGTAALLNNLAGSVLFSAGGLVDIINIEGDTTTAAGGRIEIGLSYVFDQGTFSNESLDNYPFDPNDVLLGLFFIVEEDAGSGVVYSAVGKLDSGIMPQNETPTMATRYFPLAIGDIWQDFHSNNVDSFTEYTYRNTNKFAITNNAAVYNVKNDISSPNLENENSFYSKWDDGIYYHGVFDADADDQGFSIALTYTPPVLYLKSTFNINDTWSTITDVFIAVDGNTVDTIPVAYNYLVMAIEDVTVPAGTFQNCYKISIEVSSSNTDLNEGITIWLAENVGVVKKVSSTIDSISTQVLKYSNVGGSVYGEEVIN
jgi:hypothetical protein